MSIPLGSQARLSFVDDGSRFRGGYLTHDVSIGDGLIRLTPKSFDETTQAHIHGGPIGIETTSIARGGAEIDIVAGIVRKASDSVVEIARGSVVERVTNREDGIEQSWVFADQPGVDGDMTVDVAVHDQKFAVANDRGLHFTSPAGLGFVYGNAIWRDATGESWEITPRFVDNRIRIVVPDEVIAKSHYPAILDPVVSAELFVDNPAIGTTGFTSFQQDVAADATQYFVVWADQRDDRNFDIMGARVTAAGVITDSSSIRIGTGATTVANPVVAFVGNGFVVAWERLVAAGNNDVDAAFVSSAGAVTQLGTVAGTAANESQLAIAGRGAGALLTWQSGAQTIQGAVFSTGAFGAAFSVASGALNRREPAVGANPAGDYLVTYTETNPNDNIRGQLVTAAGALSGAAFDVTVTSAAEVQSTVGFDGTNFVTAWQASTNILGARVGPTGTLLDTTAVPINTAANAQTLPDIACTANACLVAWDDLRNQATTGRDVFAALLNTNGALTVTTNDIVLSTIARQQVSPHLALLGTTYLGVWDDNRNTNTFDVRGTRLSAAGAVLDATDLVIARNTSNFGAPTGGPTISQSTSFSTVFINDSQIPDQNIVHVRFTSTGAQSDNPPRLVSGASGDQIQPSGATVGGNSLVVWSDSRNFTVRNIFAARTNPATGAVIDANGIQLSSGTGEQVVPKVASAGNSALAVWQDRRNANFDIFGSIIDSTGAVTAIDIPVCLGAGDQTRPSVVFDSVNATYLVVFTDPSGATLDIRGVRVSTAGVVLDANCGVVISGAAGSQFSADAACAAGQCLVAWEDRRNDATLGDIFASRVTLTGGAINVLDPAGIAVGVVAGSAQSAPTVAANNGYLIAWQDTRNAATTGADIFGGQVGTNGSVTSTFAISSAVEDESLPDLVAGATGANPFSIAYLKKNNALDATRLQVRRITLSAGSGQSCTSNAQCETGFCRDFKCCNTDCGGGGVGGLTTDCQACSVAHRGDVDGTCTTIQANKFYVCRLYADPFCDRSDVCDGTSTSCTADLGQRQGQVCNAGTGAVCPANDITGAPHVCP